MSVQNSTFYAPLPRSFYFLTISRGSRTRTVAIRVALGRMTLVAMAIFGVLGLGAILALLFHDQLVASLMARQSQMQYAYEDRIDALRGELQRESARQIKDQASIETRMHDLLSKAAALAGHDAILASLAPRPEMPTSVTPKRTTVERSAAVATPVINPLASRPDPLPPGVMSFAPPALGQFAPSKPRPEDEVAAPPPISAKPTDRVSLMDTGHLSLPRQLALATMTLDGIEQTQTRTLLLLGSAARERTAKLSALLDDIGLSADRFRRVAPAAGGMGGPFVPLPQDGAGNFDTTLAGVESSIAMADHLRHAVTQVPLRSPVSGAIEVTSPFGARIDPFLGRPSLHTGVDLREEFGVGAKATAAGRVTFAGPLGGYGNMVEIDHGNGLTSRYAHLEAILVSLGQMVERGEVVGEVGATGRATGPHLHYEVRIDGEPVDPMRFIAWNMRIAALTGQE